MPQFYIFNYSDSSDQYYHDSDCIKYYNYDLY